MKNPNEIIEMENLLELPSVGCVIDLDEQIVYPLFENGALDLGGGVEVSELDQEWVKALHWEELAMLNNSGIYFE